MGEAKNIFLKIRNKDENQDGGIGRHTAPPRTTRTDRKSNGKKYDTKEIKNKQSSRRVGGSEMGSRGGEDSWGCGGTETGAVWDERNRQSDHWQTLRPHIRADKLRGLDSEWRSTLQPYIRAQINRTNGGEQTRLSNPGLQRGEIKPQISD